MYEIRPYLLQYEAEDMAPGQAEYQPCTRE